MRTDKVTAHLANERTYLAWVRTGIVVITLGFAVARFGLALTSVVEVIPGLRYSSVVGTALVLLGGVLELFAFFRYRSNQKMISANSYEAKSSAEAILSVAVFLLAILILARLLLNT
ncbi:MAG: YidH family protein [Candidatus Bathyarchaeia archaeon]